MHVYYLPMKDFDCCSCDRFNLYKDKLALTWLALPGLNCNPVVHISDVSKCFIVTYLIYL